MKKISFILFLLSVVFINRLTAQSAVLSFTNPTIIGNKFRVSLHVASVGGSFGMGSNNLAFNYSTAALSNPVIISTVFATPTFSSVNTTGSSLGILRVNAVYSTMTSANTNAVPITAAGMDVAVIEFNYNAAASIALSWRITGASPAPTIAIVDDDKITARTVKHFSNSVNLSAGVDKTVRCDADSTTLIVGGGKPPYLWSNGTSAIIIKVKPSVSTTYTVIDSNSMIDTVNINVLNSVFVNDDITVNCFNPSPTTLTAKCGGGNSYLWSNGETTATIVVNPSVTTTYSVTATNGTTDEVKVTVYSTPTAYAGPDVTVNCANYSTILHGTSNCSNCIYEWTCVSDLNDLTVNANNANVTITTTNDNTARFKVTNPTNGCYSIDYVNIHVDKTQPDITISNDVTIDCNAPQPITLTATTNGVNLIWSNGSTNNSITVNPTTSSAYSVTATNTNGCTNRQNVVVVCSNTPNYVKVAMKAFLSNVDPSTQLMTNYMATFSNFPLSDPYAASGAYDNNFTHVNNPVVATISPNVLAITGHDAVVDWMFIELRKGIPSKPIVRTIAALIQADGDIVAMDGISPLRIDSVSFNFYYIIVRHHNHLGFRTLNPILLSSNATTLNFANNSVPLYGSYTPTPYSPIVYVMNGGDANSDGSIDAFDTIIWEYENGSFNSFYNLSDYNLDGSVDAIDSIFWELNNGKFQELD